MYRLKSVYYTHPEDIYRCLALTIPFEFARFLDVKVKTHVNALIKFNPHPTLTTNRLVVITYYRLFGVSFWTYCKVKSRFC